MESPQKTIFETPFVETYCMTKCKINLHANCVKPLSCTLPSQWTGKEESLISGESKQSSYTLCASFSDLLTGRESQSSVTSP